MADSGIAASPVLPPPVGGQLTAPVVPGGPPHVQVSGETDSCLVDWLLQHGADHLTVSRVSTEGSCTVYTARY